MAKPFFDVFPTLKLEEPLNGLFEKVEVEKVTATKQKDFIRVYIRCDRLIHKESIFYIEQEIRRQLFHNCPVTIKIYEKFHLSAQYNPEKFM